MTRTYVITGTSRGIGLEMTRQLLKAGHTVLALARSPSKALVDLHDKYSDRLSVYSVDVNSDEQVSTFTRQLAPKLQVDVLVNNAGVYGDGAPFEKVSLEGVMKTIATNSVAPMRITHALLPYLTKSNNAKIIHITSLMGSISDNKSGGYYGYRMSKAALNMFHKSFSKDFPQFTSLVIHPGWVKTDMGGQDAPLTPEESVEGILAVIERVTHQDSGKFLDYEGDEIPW